MVERRWCAVQPAAQLTIADVRAELHVSRSTFYDWRPRARPRMHYVELPNGRAIRGPGEQLDSLEVG